MMLNKRRGTYPSSNGRSVIRYYVYPPRDRPRALLQISHGMGEYLERYEDFIAFMNKHDILVFGNDHLGHKGSTYPGGRMGYFAETGGWRCLIEDTAFLTGMMKAEYPSAPFFILGHSMGSLVTRLLISRYYRHFRGALLLGTSGPYTGATLGVPLISAIKLCKGEFYQSPFINRLLFGAYNDRIPDAASSFSWLCSDPSVVAAYERDPYCGFLFTASAYLDLVRLMLNASDRRWYDTFPKDFPLLLLSGEADPLGEYGKGIRKLCRKLKKERLTDITMKLYPQFRHEILNEPGRGEVYGDILAWLAERIPIPGEAPPFKQ